MPPQTSIGARDVTTPLLAVDRDRIAAAARRVMARCEELARVTATPGAIERVVLHTSHHTHVVIGSGE